MRETIEPLLGFILTLSVSAFVLWLFGVPVGWIVVIAGGICAVFLLLWLIMAYWGFILGGWH